MCLQLVKPSDHMMRMSWVENLSVSIAHHTLRYHGWSSFEKRAEITLVITSSVTWWEVLSQPDIVFLWLIIDYDMEHGGWTSFEKSPSHSWVSPHSTHLYQSCWNQPFRGLKGVYWQKAVGQCDKQEVLHTCRPQVKLEWMVFRLSMDTRRSIIRYSPMEPFRGGF